MKGRSQMVWLGIVVVVLLLGIVVFGWQKKQQAGVSAVPKPQSLVMTIGGDARTTMAFTWQTEGTAGEPGILQIAEGRSPVLLGARQRCLTSRRRHP